MIRARAIALAGACKEILQGGFAGIICAGLILLITSMAACVEHKYTTTHDCGTDTCAVSGHMKIINPNAVSYTD